LWVGGLLAVGGVEVVWLVGMRLGCRGVFAEWYCCFILKGILVLNVAARCWSFVVVETVKVVQVG